MGLVLSIKFIDSSELGAARADVILTQARALYEEVLLASEPVPGGTLYHIAAKQITRGGCGTCPNMTENCREWMRAFASKIINEVLHIGDAKVDGVKTAMWEINDFEHGYGTAEFREMKDKITEHP